MMSKADRATLIIAIALALFLWAYVRLTHAAPEITRLIKDVKVTTVGSSPSGFACELHNDDHSVNVEIKGRAELINSVSREDVKVQADISGISSLGNTVVHPRVILPKGLRLARDPEVTVITYQLRQQSFPVTVAFMTQPPPGTTVGEYILQPNMVTVEGKRDALQQVKYVTVRIDPNQPFTAERAIVPRAVDADGEPVTGTRVLNSTIGVRMASLTGEQTTRQIAVGQPELKNLPHGYSVRVLSIRPSVVTLSGESAMLDKLQGFISTAAIDVHAITKDTTRTVAIKVPNGLSVVEGSTVRVDLEAQPVQ